MNKLFTLTLVFVVTLFSSVGVLAQDVVVVSTETLSNLVVEQTQSAPATVAAANHAVVAAQVSAQILAVEVAIGSRVKKGQLLASLDTRDFELTLDQAKAALASTDAQIAQARQRLQRAQELSTSDYISADDLLARETDVTVFTANRAAQVVAVNIAQNNLRKTRIIAPFDAIVVERHAQVGSFGTPGSPLFELSQVDGREVEAFVASDLVPSLESGANVRFLRNNKVWPLTIKRISPVVNSESGTQRVRLVFSADAAAIGSSGRLNWASAIGMLPANMLVQRGDQLGVFVARGEEAKFVAVAGAQEGRPVAVDLPGETLLVTKGRFKLQDASKIRVAND